MMDLDVENLTGAAYGERSVVRTNQRNGCGAVSLPRQVNLSALGATYYVQGA
jgi:hypothetical protein